MMKWPTENKTTSTSPIPHGLNRDSLVSESLAISFLGRPTPCPLFSCIYNMTRLANVIFIFIPNSIPFHFIP